MISYVRIAILKKLLPSDTMYVQLENGFRARYDIDKFLPVTMVKFEDGEFPAPNDPNAFLTAQYGAWEEIPPPEKRPHHATIILPTVSQKLPVAMDFPID